MAWAHAVIAAGRDALDVPFSASILLHNFNYNNSVATRGGDAWRITGVFDLMEAAVGDGERDLCRQTAMYLSQAPGLPRAFVRRTCEIEGRDPVSQSASPSTCLESGSSCGDSASATRSSNGGTGASHTVHGQSPS